MKKWHVSVILVLIFAALIVGVFVFRQQIGQYVPLLSSDEHQSIGSHTDWGKIEVVASNINTPWSVSFLPNDDMLVTERSGNLKRVGGDGTMYPIDGVQETSEGGLLGVAVHPSFAENKRVYLYYTTRKGRILINAVDQFSLTGDTLIKNRTIITDIPAADNHNGGGIAFGPDGKLYITTGDAADRDLAQDTNSLAGKILRMNDDGTVPSDNPFKNLTWSYGHRNPQGITWDNNGHMWSVEHGPSGEWKGEGKDELNYIQKGGNYGWPVIVGDETRSGMHAPVLHSGDKVAWAPAGITHIGGSLFFTGLRGQTLYEARINSVSSVTLSHHYALTYGRLRAVTVHNDNLYFASSNRDGRGSPHQNDDKVYRVKIHVIK